MLSAVTVLIVIVGLVQLPILTDLLLFLFPSSPLPRLASRATKPIFVLLLLASAALALHLFFLTFLPLTLHSLPPSTSPHTTLLLALLLSLLALHLILNLLYHYSFAAFSSPSPPHPHIPPPSSSNPTRFCHTCQSAKPHRTHHCRLCNRCTSLMDHHCPFTSNCVGALTLRPFYLFLAYATLGLLYSATLSYPAFSSCILYRSSLPLHSPHNFTFTPTLLPHPPPPHPLYSRAFCKSLSNSPWTFLLVAVGLVPVMALWVGQTWLVWKDRTTIEVVAGWGGGGRGGGGGGGGGKGGEGVWGGEGDGGEAGRVIRERRVRKEWALIHRQEPLYRLLAPDPVWWLCRRARTKDKA